MFIKKVEYKDLLDEIHNLNIKNVKLWDEKHHIETLNRIAEDKVTIYKEQHEAIKKENEELKETISVLENRNATLDISVQDLLEENEKLIDWITKIINDLGCYKVNDHTAIEIPILNNDIERFEDMNKVICGRKITIPEIKFFKVS